MSDAPAPIGAVAHYTLLERLEPAGPGELFRARDTRLGRTVAIRLLPADYAPDAASRHTLIESARSLIALSHPNVTTVFDVGEHLGRVFLVFEFLKGQPLRAEMAGQPMHARRALEIAIQIADGVADAHASGFVHGGLSPDSIVVTAKGHAKIPAFELAARTGFEESGSGGVKLRDYDSPEEARGQGADDRSDIYSVGAILYEMLTTRRPMHRGASAPSAANNTVPPEVDDIVLKALSPNVASRYQSAATFVAELRSAGAILDERERAVEAGHAASGGPSFGRAVGLSALILLGLALLLAWLMR